MLAIVLPSVFGGLLCVLLLCVAVGIRERRRRQSKRETSVRMHRDSSDFAAHIMPFAADADADADAGADAVKQEVPAGRAGSEGAYEYAKLDGRRPSSPTKAHSQTIALTLTLPLPSNPPPPP